MKIAPKNYLFFLCMTFCLLSCFPQFAFAGGGKLAPIALTAECPAKANRGEIITCVVRLTNTIHEDYWEVHLTGPTLSHLTIVTEHLPHECKASSTTSPKCSFSPLKPGQTKTYNFKLRVSDHAPCDGMTTFQVDVTAKDAETNWAKDQIMFTCVPKPECSDSQDNDGDGKIDFPHDPQCTSPMDDDESPDPECFPGTTQDVACGTGLNGVCAIGRKWRTCTPTGWWGPYGACVPNITPGTIQEICGDGKDNDCDGKIDNQDPDCDECTHGQQEYQHCNSGLPGICSAGKRTRTCTHGWWGDYGSCVAKIAPGTQVEICNDGLDNNCNGLTDDDDTPCALPSAQCQTGKNESRSCTTGLSGMCSQGKQYRFCQNNSWADYGTCFATMQPSQQQEVCSDQKDNDCDGLTDEGCATDKTPVGHNPTGGQCKLKAGVTITKAGLAPEKLRAIAMKAASHVTRRLSRAARRSRGGVRGALKYGRNAPALCDSLYTKSMDAVGKFPDTFFTCNHADCVKVNHTDSHDSYTEYVHEMTKVTRKLSRSYNRAVGVKSRRLLRLRKNANKEKRTLMASLSAFPYESHRCK